MNLLIFKFKLLTHLTSFLLNLFFIQIKKAKSAFLTVFILFFIINLIFFYFVKDKINNQTVSSDPTYSPTRPDLYKKSKKTKLEIQSEILYWESIIEKQPSSRDALINLSILKKTMLQNEEAEKLWNKAKLIDPNNPVFKK